MEMLWNFAIKITGFIYGFAADAFHIFVVLAKANTLDSKVYSDLVDNFYLLLSVVMLFIVAFSLLSAMVNPEEKKGEEKSGKVVKNFVTSIIILAFLPTIFSFAFSFQNAVIDYNTIGKLFGGVGAFNNDSSDSMATAGYSMANDVFLSFFVPNDCKENMKGCYHDVESDDPSFLESIMNLFSLEEADSYSLEEAILLVNKSGEFGVYSDFAGRVDSNEIEFNFLVALIAGGFLLWIVVSFCLDLGIRMAKLIFYQVIAPIPVLLRIVPDGKLSTTFNDWLKVTVTCYLEVFIRLFIIYFGVYLISIMPDALSKGAVSELVGVKWLLAKGIIILGIVTFMKQAPKLIGDLFGIDSSNMGLNLKEKLAAGGLFAAAHGLARGGAMIGGGITSGTRNLLAGIKDNKGKGIKGGFKTFGSTFAGTTSGAFHGFKSGKGAKSFADMKQAATSGANKAGDKKQRRELYRANHGGDLPGVIKGKTSDMVESVKTWAGVSKIDATESQRYDSAASAFDAAHTMSESVYKNKPGHNKLKEKVAELDSKYQNALAMYEQQYGKIGNINVKETNDRIKDLNKDVEGLRNNYGPLTIDQQNELEVKTKELESLSSKLSGREKVLRMNEELNLAKSEQKIHEAGELTKKNSIVREAVNKVVNAKIAYSDLADQIVTDEQYKVLMDAGNETANIAEKIKRNEVITEADFRNLTKAQMNALDDFMDKVGISAKNLATNKRIELGHATALDNNSGSKDSGK